MMIAKPATKYQAMAPVALPDRQWPSRSITRAPRWLSTDLRDGNQALFEPMNGERKMKLFLELVREQQRTNSLLQNLLYLAMGFVMSLLLLQVWAHVQLYL